MRYSYIIPTDIANGVGVGVSLYVQGCSHHCLGCFNPETWDYEGGKEYTEETQETLLHYLSKPFINHLSILGGEPLDPKNVKTIEELIIKTKDSYPHIKIWLWTGYTWNQLQEIIKTNDQTCSLKSILKTVDYLIDGPFIQEEKDLTLSWRGSRNQRIIKSAETIKTMSDSPLLLEE